MNNVDRTDKKSKWTIMKYVKNFGLLVKYASLIRRLNARVDEESIAEINTIMKDLHVYQPRFGKPSLDTTNFKICQIVYSMFAYRNDTSENREIVFSPLGNLLLDNLDKSGWVAKIYATMLYGLPFSHPYNKMNPSFDLFPVRLLFRLLSDERLDCTLFEDEVFYHVFWTKQTDNGSYERLVKALLRFRALSDKKKLAMCTLRRSEEDALANALHETKYLFGQLQSAGIAVVRKGRQIGTLRQGGFGRRDIPDFLSPEESAAVKPTGHRKYAMNEIRLAPAVKPLVSALLSEYPFTERPHDLLNTLGRQDYVLHLYNFYPPELLADLGISKSRVQTMLHISKDIDQYSRNREAGDCYRFEEVLADAFNEFDDVTAKTIGGAGNTDIECLYLTIDEKFAVEAKSTRGKLTGINAGRLQLHRNKIKAKYTIVVAPYYMPSVEADIAGTDNVMVTASSLSNFLYQSAVHRPGGFSYAPLYDIVRNNMGRNITTYVNDYVAGTFGIGRG